MPLLRQSRNRVAVIDLMRPVEAVANFAAIAEAGMVLSGTVDSAGEVNIEMNSQGPAGRRMAHLTGTLRDGHLDATGEFQNGRTVSFRWHRS